MILGSWSISPDKIIINREICRKRTFPPIPTNNLPDFSIFSTKFIITKPVVASFKCSSTKKEYNNVENIFEEFSVLSSLETPWGGDSIWSTMGLYFFSLHIPLSFGGLSVVAQILQQPVLDPQIEAVSILLIVTMELFGTLALLGYTKKTDYKLASFFFQSSEFSKQRRWVKASCLGFGFLIFLVFLTSFVADILIGTKDVNNPMQKEILSSGPIAKTALFFLYCFITPLLEETVYRGFLLTSLCTSKMKWQQAVILSSFIFSLAHFSSDSSPQLFIIGCVLGCSYCWSGSLLSSFTIHALYNALTLIVTILS
ncbi:hypothetical protein MKW98_024700 [Papaver atlanticum]|uniref:CAAX prenyl protease 2/Lysostaphin resistance protein A-like domain-containing protein n=1 Tax=Papaver atlanticum TaxID=357466 RepID=A0AAD4S235_9MAGN|nr:hypothetical protein MKW98_024700 [Papaver atlanticum]